MRLTEEQIIALYDARHWEGMSYRERAMFQLFETRISMPFSVSHEAVEKTLNRPVSPLEFAVNLEGLRKEILGEAPMPTLEDIISLIPKEKRIILIAQMEAHNET